MAEMDQLFEHIDDIEIAMLTTRRPDGHLCSRCGLRFVLRRVNSLAKEAGWG